MWAVATQEDAALVADWAEFYDIQLPILLDTDGSVTADYAQTMPFEGAAYPQEWLIGTDGVIELYANRYEPDALQAVIERELAEM